METCPKCTTSGKPTPLRRDIALYGGGSSENRQSGDKNIEGVHFWTCWQCGYHKDILPEPMVVKHNTGRRDNRSVAVFDNFIAENMDKIKRMKKRRLSYLKIAEILSVEFGSTIAPSTLQRRYQESI